MSKWLKSIHPSSQGNEVFREVLERTGIGAQIDREIEEKRVNMHADARKRKAAAVARYLREKVPAEALIKQLDAKEREAADVAAQLRKELISAREALSTVYGTMNGEVAECDRIMRTCYSEKIDEFLLELEELHRGCVNLYRAWPDENGKLVMGLSKTPASDNRVDIEQRVHAIVAAKDAAQRLKVDPDIDDVDSAITKIRASIPGVE